MESPRYVGFEKASIDFLAQLAANNNREWFNENKARYEQHVLDVALRFIQSMQDPLAQLAPKFTAIPQRAGGSLMRVYRDTRFSHNKQPYKTNVGIQFRHQQAKDVHSPGYYVHVDPERVFIGVGMWRPDPDALRAIRERIVAKPAEWKGVLRDVKFRRHFDLGGESLSRAPRGFDKDHELIKDIKRKSFIAVRDLDVADCLNPQFQRKVEASFAAATPFMQFLCKAVGVPF
ncbi:MAG TPA: DUF2461 domain-containing protein [Woeseiaceae bacterium]|nr:DUF2461 domain-containing protein [Woeseiaceae bacterium]